MAYSAGIFFADYVNGVDTARANLVPSAYANNGSGLVRVTVGGLGTPAIVTDAVVDIAGTTGAVYNGAWKVTVINSTTIDLQGSTYSVNPAAKGTCIPRGGDSWANAWKTLTTGASAARIAPGDTIRMAKSPNPTNLGGNGSWTNGPIPAALSSPTSDTSTPIVMTMAGHTFVAGDVAQVVGHTANVGTNGANGYWIVGTVAGNTFQLLGTTPLAGNGSGGTVKKINAKAVILAGASAALTLQVDRCEVAWSGANGVTPTRVGIATDCKSGDGCVQITAPAAPATGTLYGYSAFTATNYTTIQNLTFWVKNEAAVLATHWTLCLCSGADGTGVVGTVALPAIPSTGYWVPLNIALTGVGDLSAVQSIALISGSVAPTASKYLRLDNIVGTTTAGLNMQSLISKNSAPQGGTEPWLGIQSILPLPLQTKTLVLLDNGVNTLANAGRGYTGTTESAPAYIRETIKTVLAAGDYDYVQISNKNGTASAPITYAGGYNTATGSSDGETIFDGLSGKGYGLYGSSHFCGWSHLVVVRYQIGFGLLNGIRQNVTMVTGNNCVQLGLFFAPSNLSTFVTIQANNNANGGIQLGSTGNSALTTVTANNNINSGIATQTGVNRWVGVTAQNNSGYGMEVGGSNSSSIYALTTVGNVLGGVSNAYGITYLFGASIAETPKFGGAIAYGDSHLFSQDHGGLQNHIIYTDGGTITTLATTRVGGTGIMWRFAPGATRLATYPLGLSVAKVAVVADKAVTVTLNFKKSDATNIAAQIIVKGGQLAGVAADVTALCPSDVTWDLVSMTPFTPTVAGVIEVQVQAWYVGGVATVDIDDITITQAA